MKKELFFCLSTLAFSSVSAQDTSKFLNHPGLEIWRQPDHQGASCMNCHGPLPVDIALMNVPEDHLFVRDIFHVSAEESAILKEYIDLIESELPQLKQVDRFSFRPFQPGGEVLAEGETNVARDRAFFEYLKEQEILLISGNLQSHRDALIGIDQVLGINLFDLKVGLEFPLISSDFHFGSEFESINEWITAHPIQPTSTTLKDEWLALQDAYIADPSDENFWKMYIFGYEFKSGRGNGNIGAAEFDGVDETIASLLTESEVQKFTSGMHKARRFVKNQYGSLLILQHILLREAMGKPMDSFLGNGGVALSKTLDLQAYNSYHPRSSMSPNPFWEVGHGAGKDSAPSWLYKNVFSYRLNMGDFPKDRVSREVLRGEIGAPWFWLGWMFDFGVNRINKSNSTKNMEYFNQTLQQYYPAHLLFASFTKNHFEYHLADTNPRDYAYELKLPSFSAWRFLKSFKRYHGVNDPAYTEEVLQAIRNGYAMHIAGIKEAFRLQPYKTYRVDTLKGRIKTLRDDLNGLSSNYGNLDIISVNRKLDRLIRLHDDLIANP